jgi:hypothetical protein
MRGAAGDVEIDREQAVDAIGDIGKIGIGAAGKGAGADGNDQFGIGNRFVGFNSACRMLAVTGPVTSRPSACRGEATNWMPYCPRSNTSVFNTLVSASQALQPPALTWRTAEIVRTTTALYGPTAPPVLKEESHITKSCRVLVARACRVVNRIAPSGQAFSQSPQKRHLPRSIVTDVPVFESAPVGQLFTQALQSKRQRPASSAGRPRYRSGSFTVSGE